MPWPVGGGATGALIRDYDWSTTALGAMRDWPQVLRIKVNSIVNSPIPQVLMWGPQNVMLYNDGYIEIAGARHPRALGGSAAEIWPEIWDWNSRVLADGFQGKVQAFREQHLTVRRNGQDEQVVFDLFYTPIHCEQDNRVGGVLCTVLDITRAVASREELAASRQRFAAAVKATHGVLWTNDPEGRMTEDQRGWAALTGQTREEYRGHGWLQAVHPDDQAGSLESWQRAVDTRSTYTWEHRVRRHDGVWRNFAIRATPSLNDQGEIQEWVGVHTDITEQRHAEEQLRQRAYDLERQVRHRQRAEEQLRQLNESLEARIAAEVAERRKTERALQQAQKMESLGQLTGGVAHDFNNLLQVIGGNLHLLQRELSGNARAEQRVQHALAGVQRGAKLASQLLAFGRRQPLDPRVIHVGKLIAGMDELLRRSLGETVQVEVISAGGLWNTCVDPAQLENALLNLAINARDAMEGSGRLTVEVGNIRLDQDYADANSEVKPGQYVMLAVSDTGSGMGPEVLDKVFEPFFSTKPEGKGTGLGLSMVYGFVKQSGGHVAIYSEPGHGTTVRLYLPRSMAEEDRDTPVMQLNIERGSETILVVEDDDAVRETVIALLTDLGYHVLTARDPQAGLSVIESGAPIDLLFTDVVMPGPITSREMTRRAQDLLPGLAVLFTSGYTQNSIVHGGRLDAGVELLSKPYTQDALARRLRQMLSARSGSDTPAQPVAAANDHAPVAAAALRVLLVEDNALIRADTAMMLEDLGHRVIPTGTAGRALELLEAAQAEGRGFDLLLTDLGLPDMRGDQLSLAALERDPSLALVYATGESMPPQGSPAQAVLLAKPYGDGQLRVAVERALAARQGN